MITGFKPATPEQLWLLHAVPLRRTNRHPYADDPVSRPEQSALRRRALDEGGRLEIVDAPGRRTALRDIAARAHRAQMADPAFRAEFARTGRADTDSVPATASAPAEPQDRWVLRDYTGDYTGGNRPARPAGEDFENEPLIAVQTTHLSGLAADVQAGQALQRFLLTATADGLATSFRLPRGRGAESDGDDMTRPVTRWTVVIDIDEVDGAVRAVAQLHDRTSDRLVGEGVAHVGPVERVAPTAGPRIATARALRRLSEQLAAAAKHDYETALDDTALGESTPDRRLTRPA